MVGGSPKTTPLRPHSFVTSRPIADQKAAFMQYLPSFVFKQRQCLFALLVLTVLACAIGAAVNALVAAQLSEASSAAAPPAEDFDCEDDGAAARSRDIRAEEDLQDWPGAQNPLLWNEPAALDGQQGDTWVAAAADDASDELTRASGLQPKGSSQPEKPPLKRGVSGGFLVLDRSVVLQRLRSLGSGGAFWGESPGVVPNYRNGRYDGYRLMRMGPSAIWREIGFENGDVLKIVEGVHIDSPVKRHALWRAFLEKSTVSVQFERGGERLQLRFRLE